MEVIKPYSTYKDSGIPWLGDVPEHWEVKKLKFLLKLQKGKNPKDFSADKVSLPYLSMEYLRGKTIIKTYVLPQDNLVEVQEDDILVLWDGANAGEILKSKHGFLSSTMAVINFNKNFINKKYFFQFLKSLEKEFKDFSTGTTIPHFNSDILLNNHYCIPTLSEQTAIANFLDYKTAKIDRFIFKKKQLIKLLNEQKAGIINDTVTKGLNPNAKIKPSGIEWLGDIPEHWDLVKLKYLCKITTGNKNTEDKVENGLYDFFVRSQKIAKINSYSFEGEGILTAGDGVGVGKVFHYINGKCDYHQRVYLFYEFFKNISAKYLFYFLQKFLKNELMIYNAKSTVDSVRLPVLKDFLVTVPQFSEQLQIVAHIEKETSILSKTIATIEKEIALVQEYRTALIAEAVTGKIDVREYNVPSFEEDKEYVELEEEMGLVAEEEINLD